MQRGRIRTRIVAIAALLALLTQGCALVVRSSVAVDGTSSDGASSEAVLSQDGRYAAFTSLATDLVASDPNGVADVFRRDHQAGTTVLISADAGGGAADGPSGQPRTSADGQRVAFTSLATDLVASDANGVADVFVRDVVAGTTVQASVADDESPLTWPSGATACQAPGTGCVPAPHGLALDAAGTLVAFVSVDPVTERSAVLLRDLVAQTTTALVVAPDASGVRYEEVALSGDGSRAAVTARVPQGSGPDRLELSVVDVATLAATAVSATDAGATPTCCSPVLSADGSSLAFLSDQQLVAEDDAVGVLDVDAFVWDLGGGTVERVSLAPDGTELDGGVGDLSMSADGGVVAWSSSAVVPGVPGGFAQTFVRDRAAGVTQVASTSGLAVADAAAVGSLSGDGQLVALVTEASNLVADDAGAPADVVLRLAQVPGFTGTAEVQAGAAGTVVTLAGQGFTGAVQVTSLSFDVRVDATTVNSTEELALTVTTMPGASLGPRRLWVKATGPYGVEGSALCDCLSLTWSYAAPTAAPTQPSFLIINTDDQRFDSMDQLPLIDGRADWARFSQALVNEPQCCPSRATMFSGQLGMTNDVLTLRDGEFLDESQTVATMLHDAGYQTHLSGKYLNGYPWPGLRGYYVPQGWDDFIAFMGPNTNVPVDAFGRTPGYAYVNYTNVENGVPVDYTDDPWEYSTDRYAAATRQFLRSADPDRPLYAYLAPIAPHFIVRPADRHVGSCADRTFPDPPNYKATDTVSEPDWMQWAVASSDEQLQNELRGTCETLQAVDEAVASLLVELEAAGRLDNTYVVFTSDNGYSFGEHNLVGKGHLFEESVRVPLLVLGPDVLPGTIDRLTTNADITPTVLDLAGVAPPVGYQLDGQSFADDLRGLDTVANPDEVLLIGCRTTHGDGDYCGGYNELMGWAFGLRTDRYKYVEYFTDGDRQLFDLQTDPYELTNLIDDPAHAAVVADLSARLAARTAGVGKVRGTVVDDAGGLGVQGIQVWAWTSATGWRWWAQTDDLGRFALPPLAPGSYTLRFSDPDGIYNREYYPDAPTRSSATPVTVTGGGITEVVASIDSSPPGTVAGVVTAQGSGAPLAGINVWLHDDVNGYFANTTTAADGSYSFTVGSGPGRHLRFTDPSGTYAREYYDDVATLTAATPVDIPAGGTVTADVVMAP